VMQSDAQLSRVGRGVIAAADQHHFIVPEKMVPRHRDQIGRVGDVERSVMPLKVAAEVGWLGLIGMLAGVTVFDASAGGLGGCPYAPGAAGNLATEDLLYMLHGMGIKTGVNLEQVVAATRFIAPLLGHAPTSKYYQAAESECLTG